MTRRVAVIGAGPAGLAAFHRLRSAGADAHIFDGGPVGGMMRTVRRGEWLVETGAHALVANDERVVAMLGSIGAELVPSSPAARRRYVLFRGSPVGVPMSGGELVASPLLTMAGRLRLLREPFVRARGVGADESVDAFARRRFGKEVAARMLDPIVSSSTGGDPHHLLARALFPTHVEYERLGGSVLRGAMRAGMQARRRPPQGPRGPVTMRSGVTTLGDAILAAGGAERFRGVAVEGIDFRADGVSVIAGTGPFGCDAVVVAVPAPALGAISFAGIDAQAIGTIAAMPHASVASISMGYRRDAITHPLDGASLLVPSAEQRAVLATFFDSTMFEGRAPAGHVLLTSLAGGIRHPELCSQPEGQLAALVHEHLRSALGASGEPSFVEVTRWPGSMPQPVEGHFDRLDAADRLEATVPRIALAGGWRGAMSVGDAMASGIRAADRVLTGA